MKKIILAATLACYTSTAFAGGMAEAIVQPQPIVVQEATSSSAGGWLVPLLLLVVVGAAIASNNGGNSNPVDNPT